MSLVDIEDVGSRLVTVDTVVGNPSEVSSVGSRLVTVYKDYAEATTISSVGSRLVTTYVPAPNATAITTVGSRLVTVNYDPFRNDDTHTRAYTLDGTMAFTVEVNFTGLVDAGLSPTQVEVDIFNNDVPEQLVQTFPTTLSGGQVTLTSPTRQLLFIRVRQVGTWLGKKVPIDLRASPQTVVFNLLNGDVDGNNLIDIADYSLLAAAFDATSENANWFAQADLNQDGIVDIADYTILATNFDKVGD
ncbi:MAG: hypothetical protein JNJ45_05295 [Chthonomonas sp.]|nr:hypothetical protein [Chthonomonas sp.]